MLEHYLSLPSRYYSVDHYYDFLAFFSSIPKETRVLNLGCGRAASLKEYPNGVGVDFNSNLAPLWKEQGVYDRCLIANVAEGLEYDDHHFDWTISTDFLEHLQPEDVQPAVKELVRLAPAGRHVIDLLQESGFRGPKGENLHPSANDAKFWSQAFTEAGVQSLAMTRQGQHLFLVYDDSAKKA